MPAMTVATATPAIVRTFPRLRPNTLVFLPAGHDGVIVRVRRRAAAQQDERFLAVVEQLVRGSRRDHDAVAGDDLGLIVPEAHPAGAGDEVVELFAPRVIVLSRLAVRRQGRLGEALVAGGGPRRARQLADLAAVERGERRQFPQVCLLHLEHY